jgi:hypothetical protein
MKLHLLLCQNPHKEAATFVSGKCEFGKSSEEHSQQFPEEKLRLKMT